MSAKYEPMYRDVDDVTVFGVYVLREVRGRLRRVSAHLIMLRSPGAAPQFRSGHDGDLWTCELCLELGYWAGLFERDYRRTHFWTVPEVVNGLLLHLYSVALWRGIAVQRALEGEPHYAAMYWNAASNAHAALSTAFFGPIELEE